MTDQTDQNSKTGGGQPPLVFAVFNEIGIINQLSTALFQKRLPDGIHVSHFSILNHLSKRDFDETPVMLADAFQVTKGTMTHSLQVLKKRGFVVLTPNPKDGRSKIVKITPEGRAFLQQAVASLAPGVQKLTMLLDQQELVEILPALTRLRQILDENRDI
ncbi:MAG: MarR family winged helix-turn-helix transcriptional regulator [Pseudomonadota bacterium]